MGVVVPDRIDVQVDWSDVTALPGCLQQSGSNCRLRLDVYLQENSLRIRLRPLKYQVMVITGASSGIGLATARLAARHGARLVVVARNARALQMLVDELAAGGHEAMAVVADVGVQEDIQRVVRQAIERFGRVDTWINNAGVSMYGSLDDPTIEENRRLFDTNFWGVVHGSLAARQHLRGHGGAIITVGSLASDIGTPVQGMYSASKHAVKGFIDALRVESARERLPVSITLIKPASINSMLPLHARNFMPVKPDLPPPIYAPQAVAEAIVYAAEHPVRDIFVGEPAIAGAMVGHYAPGLMDKILETFAIRYQKNIEQREDRPVTGNLFAPADQDVLQVSPDQNRAVLPYSPYTLAVTAWKRPVLIAGTVAALVGFLHRWRTTR